MKEKKKKRKFKEKRKEKRRIKISHINNLHHDRLFVMIGIDQLRELFPLKSIGTKRRMGERGQGSVADR